MIKVIFPVAAATLTLTWGLGCSNPAGPPSSAGQSTAPASSVVTTGSDDLLANEPSPAQPAEAAEAAEAESGEVELSIVEVAGLREKVDEVSGKVVVVDIWSTSCLPCMREFPHLVELSEKYSDELVCISMNVDYIGIKSKPPKSYLPKVEEFLKEQNASNVINFLSATSDSDVMSEIEAESIPAILIFDRDGELRHKLTDASSGDEGLTYQAAVIPKIEQLLNDES